MLLLSTTSHKLRLVSSSAANLDVDASFMDFTAANPPVMQGTTSGTQQTSISSATTTDIVAAPGASTIRNVKFLSVRNRHASLSCDVTITRDVSATVTEQKKFTLVAGAEMTFTEGVGWFLYTPTQAAILQKILTADDAGGQNVATAQPWFPTAGGVTVASATTYYMEGHLNLSRAAGTTAHTTSLLFGGTATLTSIAYTAKWNAGDVDAATAANVVTARVATATVAKASSTSATEQALFDVEGIVRINVGGTFIPQFIYSAAPGGAPTVKANSFIRLTPLGDNNFATQGTWA
jgi:hypothetical protein